MRYEDLRYNERPWPLIFRKDTRTQQTPPMLLHWHEAVELLLIQEGEVQVQSNTETVIARPGEIVCIHSHHLHGYTSVGEKCTYYCLIPAPELVDSAALYQSPLPLVCRDQESVALYRQVVRTLEQEDDFYRELATGLLVQLYVRLVSCGGDQMPGNDRRMTAAVKDALAYIGEHYAEPLDVEGIARSVGVSRYHLCHIFKEVTGKTLSGYWQSLRCDRAKKLLARGVSVAQAAEQCGFSSPEYFTKVYQKHFSVLPRQDKR